MVDKIKVNNLCCFYGGKEVISSLNINVVKNEILSIIGPSNSGKTSFLRTLNRMNDMNVNFSRKGNIFLDDENIFDMNPENLRKRVGMLFAMPIPLPMSIYDNISYAPKRLGIASNRNMDEVVEKSLRDSSLWTK
jgi:phosphate transport system ATP-binding protein